MKRLRIKGKDIVLPEGVNVPLEYSINDVRDISNRNTTFSQSFNIPSSQEVDELFSYLFDVHIILENTPFNGIGYNFNPLYKIDCDLYENEAKILKGSLRLVEILNDNGNITYNCSLFGSFANIYTDMKETDTLQILDTGYNDFDWSSTTVSNQNNNPSAPCFIAPIDYGKNKTDFKKWNYNELSVGFRVSWLFKSLIEYYGYTLNSNFFNTTGLTHWTIPSQTIMVGPSQTSTISTIEQEKRKVIVAGSFDHEIYPASEIGLPKHNNLNDYNYALNTNPYGAYPIPKTATPVSKDTRFRKLYTDIIIKDTYNIFDEGDFSFKVKYKANYNVNIILDWDVPPAQAGYVNRVGGFNILAYKNNDSTPFSSAQEYFNPFTSNIGGTYYYYLGSTGATTEFNLSLNLNAGDQVTLMNAISTTSWSLSNAEISAGTKQQVPQKIIFNNAQITITQNSLETGSRQSLNSFLPEMKCKDFFMGIVKYYNLQIDFSREDPTQLYIEPFEDFYLTDYVDLSGYLMRDKKITTKPLSEIGARKYSYKFKYEEDYFNKLYKDSHGVEHGEQDLVVNSDYATGENKLESIFAHSPTADPNKQGIMIPSITANDGVNVTPFVSKLFRLYGAMGNINVLTSTPFSITYSNGVWSNSWSLSDQLYYQIIDELGYPTNHAFCILFNQPFEAFYKNDYSTYYPADNIFTRFHEPQLNEFLDINSRLVTCSIDVNEDFIQNFSFRRLVMLDNQLYRINKVKYNGKDNACIFELLKVVKVPHRNVGFIEIPKPPKEKYIVDGGKDNVYKPFPLKQIYLFDGGMDINQGPNIGPDDWSVIDGGYN